jgi:hypothetical protein
LNGFKECLHFWSFVLWLWFRLQDRVIARGAANGPLSSGKRSTTIFGNEKAA